MANLGYARVSAVDQDFNGQIDQLRAAGCDKVFSEKMSAKSTNGRRALQKALDTLQPGDTLIVTKLDRLARSIDQGYFPGNLRWATQSQQNQNSRRSKLNKTLNALILESLSKPAK